MRGGEGAMRLEDTFSTLRRDICVMPVSTEYVPVFGRGGELVFVGLNDCSDLVPLSQISATHSPTGFQMSKATGLPTVAMDAGGRVRDHLQLWLVSESRVLHGIAINPPSMPPRLIL